MTRSKAGFGSDIRFADHLSIGLLARAYPLDVVNETLNAYSCNSARVRSFPASAVVYYTMALSLFPQAAYEEVFAAVVQGLVSHDKAPVQVVKSTISKARSRLDWRALQALHQRCSLPLSTPAHPHAFFSTWRLVSIDSALLDVCDQIENVRSFGYPANAGPKDSPQARYAILVERASHAVLDAELAAGTQVATTVAAPVVRRLTSDMLCMAGRSTFSWSNWQAARKCGAQLLWRVGEDVTLPVEKLLSDGTYLSSLRSDEDCLNGESSSIVVRVIDRRGAGAVVGSGMRLLTTLDEKSASADTLATLYCTRLPVDPHLTQNRRMLRSKTPELVRQEFYGWAMAHYAVRWLMYQDGPRDEHGIVARPGTNPAHEIHPLLEHASEA